MVYEYVDEIFISHFLYSCAVLDIGNTNELPVLKNYAFYLGIYAQVIML